MGAVAAEAASRQQRTAQLGAQQHPHTKPPKLHRVLAHGPAGSAGRLVVAAVQLTALRAFWA